MSAMQSAPTTFAVEGPVQAEVFVVWRSPDGLELTGPCGAAPWLIELEGDEHPVDAVARIIREVVGPPLLVHSTSWRREAGAVVLSFVAIIEPGLVGAMESRPDRPTDPRAVYATRADRRCRGGGVAGSPGMQPALCSAATRSSAHARRCAASARSASAVHEYARRMCSPSGPGSRPG